MKVSGVSTKQMVKAHSGMFMVTNMKATGLTIKLMVMEYIHMRMVLVIKDNG